MAKKCWITKDKGDYVKVDKDNIPIGKLQIYKLSNGKFQGIFSEVGNHTGGFVTKQYPVTKKVNTAKSSLSLIKSYMRKNNKC